MSDIHVGDFYKDTAKILLQLYAAFPRQSTVYVEDISGPSNPDEFGVHDNRFLACFSTMLWLKDEGYIRYVDTIRQEAVDQATLTEKCFLLLSAKTQLPVPTPDEEALPETAISEAQTLINALRRALRSRDSQAIGQVIQELLRGHNIDSQD